MLCLIVSSEEETRRQIERAPGGAEAVGSEAIKESRGANLKDVLDFVPGVLVRPRFGAADASQFSIRGQGCVTISICVA
jgi:iron complex outermembrane recepter protein